MDFTEEGPSFVKTEMECLAENWNGPCFQVPKVKVPCRFRLLVSGGEGTVEAGLLAKAGVSFMRPSPRVSCQHCWNKGPHSSGFNARASLPHSSGAGSARVAAPLVVCCPSLVFPAS